MAYNHADILSNSPYYDDFNDTKNFLRILFKPGYSVQARELTQLQTLLQNQLSTLGSHVFKNGSLVFGGVTTLTNCKFVRVSPTILGNTFTHTNLRGHIVTDGSTTGVKAKVIHTLPAQTGDNYVVLFLQYLSGTEFVGSTTTVINQVFDTTDNRRYSIKQAVDAAGIAAVGDSTLVSVDSGIFYVDGFFVNNTKQTVSLYSLTNSVRIFDMPTNRIGFSVERTTIDATEDNTLKDPANGSYNYNAPGADRYTINLVLTSFVFSNLETKPEEYSTQDFIELARTVNGKLDFVRRTPTYSDLLDIFARRTYDESGSYTVRPFGLEVKNHIRSDKYTFTATRYSGDITEITGANQLAFSYSDPNSSDLPPFPGDVLKIYNSSGTISYLDIVSVSAGVSGSSVVTMTAKYQNTDINNILPIANSTKFYLFRKGSTIPETNIYFKVTSSTVTVDQDETGTYKISDTPKGSDDKFVLSVQPGKAYVFGYEFENINNTNISVNRPRDIVSLDNYEVDTNVGNYFIVTASKSSVPGFVYAFDDYTNFNINSFPSVTLKGEFVEINIPKIADTYSQLPVKYWSPLFATEQAENGYSNVLFVNPPTGFNLALKSEGTTSGFIRPSETADDRVKKIGQQISATKSLNYTISNSSFETETNISRLVFTEPYHGNFKTAFGQDGLSDNEDQFITDEYKDTSDNFVYQVDYSNFSSLPTINSISDLSNTGIIIKKAYTRRWIPASSSGITAGSTLYVNIPTNNIIFGNTTGIRGMTLPGSNTTQEAGVVYNPEVGSAIAYGSSIENINLQNNIVQITLLEATSSQDCSETSGGTGTAGLGKFRVGDTVKQSYVKSGSRLQAQGLVLAVTEDSTPGGYKIYVEVQGSVDFVKFNETPAQYSDIGAIYGPCACYTAKTVTSLDNSTCGFFTTIKFKESPSYGDYTAGKKVFQYDIDYLPTDSTGTGFSATQCIAVGSVVSWDSNSRTLIILQEKNTFKQKCGFIFEKDTGTRYGGRGWELANKHTINEISGINEIEKTLGIFIDSEQTYVPDNGDFDPTNAFGASKQIINSSSQAYTTGKELYSGDIMTQVQPNGTTSHGKVIYFKAGEVNNPAATVAEGTTTIILNKITDKNFGFTIGVSGARALVYTAVSSQRPGFNYTVDSTTVSPSSGEYATTGTAKLRQLHRLSDDQYTVHLFDINMNNIGANNAKYPLSSTVKIADSTGVIDIFSVDSVDGVATIQSPQQNTLLFDLPVGDTINNISDFKYRLQRDIEVQYLGNETNPTLTITADVPANIRFIGGATGVGQEQGKVDTADLIAHYIFVDTDNGKIYDLSDTTYFTKCVNNNSSQGSVSELTITLKQQTGQNVLPSGTYRLIATMSVGGSTELGIRKKVKKRKTERLSFSSSSVLTISTADVVSIDYMTDTSGNIYDLSFFDFNNGQTDNVYEYATLQLKQEKLGVYSLTNTTVLISYTYFEHQGNGPIVVNSYETHNDVPVYTSPSTNQKYNLDTVIDFRPYRNSSGGLSGIYGIPVITESFSVDYSYFEAKNYKVVLTRDTQFKVLESPSSLTPIMPPDEPNSMTLFTVNSPSYLSNINDLTITSYNHQRFTMNDIRELEKRIENLEYFTKLNLLEKTAQDTKIVDSTGTELVKTSILVDGFSGHGIGDTANPDYNCSIDTYGNILRPPFKTTVVDFDISSESTAKTNNTTGLVTLNFTESPFIIQSLSSSSITVNDFANTVWVGTASLSPSGDAWFDTTNKPLLLTNIDGENDTFKNMVAASKNNNLGAFSTKWNNWQTNWQGVPLDEKRLSFTKNGITSLTRDIASRTPEVGKTKIADRVLNTDIVPFMRENTITVTITGLKPSKIVYPYFDGIRIDSYCKTADGNSSYVNGTNNRTTTSGTTTFRFNLPAGKFRIGEKLLSVMDNANGNKDLATTFAEVKYVSSGINSFKNGYLTYPRPAAVSTTDTAQTLLAQTFFVDPIKYPQGLFTNSVELFFASKDTQGIPVKLEIRPVASGYPSIGVGSVVYPYATKTLTPDLVTVIGGSSTPTPGSGDGTVSSNGTTFTFDAPVHLLPGEHSLVLISNSSEYAVYVAEVGQNQLYTNIAISEQPYTGKMYKTNNNSTWVEMQSTDLMFVANKCDFSNTGTLVLTDPVLPNASVEKYSVANVTMSYVDFGGLISSMNLETLNESSSLLSTNTIKPNTNITYTNNKNVMFDGDSVRLTINMKSDSNNNLSPVIDTEKLNFLGIRNLISTQTNVSEELSAIAYSTKARYITKTVTLEPGLEATNCSVYMKINKPQGTAVDVYIKRQIQGTDTPFANEKYELMTPNYTNFVSTSESDFQEAKYALTASEIGQEFSKFSIKVVLYSTSESVIPKIKDLRIITAT
jgi:hypothetical protein